jgi:alkyl hydroperoxide reductase subunit AhpC
MKLLSMLSVAGLAGAFMLATPTSVLAMQDDPAPKKEEKAAAPAKPAKAEKEHAKEHGKDKDKAKADDKTLSTEVGAGTVVTEFTGKDTDGKDHTLKSLLAGKKAVVLQWFNPDCPFVVKHYNNKANTFNDLYTKYGKDVTFVAVNSNADGKGGSGADRNIKAKKDWKIEYPIILDTTGVIGKQFNAKNTPLMVVITPDNKIAYYGAPDDDNGASGPGKTNYISKALDEILAGKDVTTKSTHPYGCAVKYN